jgi:hypothetical protein
MVKMKYCIYLFLALVLCGVTNNMAFAGTKEYLKLVKEQKTPVEKAVACHYVWECMTNPFEFDIRKDIRITGVVNKEDAKALMLSKIGSIFLNNLARSKGHNDLLDRAHSAGAGMDLWAIEKNKKLIMKDCIEDVLEIINSAEYTKERIEALRKADKYIRNVTKVE